MRTSPAPLLLDRRVRRGGGARPLGVGARLLGFAAPQHGFALCVLLLAGSIFGLSACSAHDTAKRQEGITFLLIDLDLPECYEMMEQFIRENPSLWNEDIGK